MYKKAGLITLIIVAFLMGGYQVYEKCGDKYSLKPIEEINEEEIDVEEKGEIKKQNEKNSEKSENAVAKLIFVGDTMMDSRVAIVMDEKGNEYPLHEFMPILKKGDFVIANLETSIGTSRKLMEGKTFTFQTAPQRFQLFHPVKDKILFSLANNHGMDGPLEETIQHLEDIGYPYVGIGRNREEAFKPYIGNINGISFAVIGVSRVIPSPTWTATDNDPGMATAYVYEPLLTGVRELRNKVDYIIVYLHWGKELEEQPNDVQLILEKRLIDAGANLIIGSHPHLLQGICWNDEKQLTAYSLGNFVFTTSSNPVANDTIALEIHLSKDKIEFVKVWPGQVQYGLVRLLKEMKERQRIFDRIINSSSNIVIKENGEVIRM